MQAKRNITLSLNPTFLCNFRCHFCYLTSEQLADTNKLDLSHLQSLLNEVDSLGYNIDHVDLYGGEIAMLRPEYLEKMDQILFEHSDPSINVITNYAIKHEYFEKEHVSLSVSFDFDVREKSEKVLLNIMTSQKNIAVLMLASKELMSKDVEEMIQTINTIGNITSVEIKPYSSNQANQHKVTDREFEVFVSKWLNSNTAKRFEFINEKLIRSSLSGSRNAFSDDHVYITPNGKFAVLDFDNHGHEFFLELDSFKDYLIWAEDEKARVGSNKHCKSCQYFGRCLTEHYRPVEDLNSSCNGFKFLLDECQNQFL